MGIPAAAPARGPVQVRPQSEWAEAILYFVILDRFADGDLDNDWDVDRAGRGTFHGGDLVGLRQQLDDLADLGVTALWITPVVENMEGFVTGAGFPDWAYHGYWADDFEKLDPRFGTEEELEELVAAAHRRGMKVLLDVVYNHVGYRSHYLDDPATRDWLRREDRGTCGSDDLTQCVAGLPDLKTERPEVADYLMRAQLSRAVRTHLDGFRLDTVKHVGHPFWQEHRRRVDEQLGPGFFLLGEVWGGDARVLDPWFADDELDAGFDFGFQGSVIAFLQGRGRTVAFDHYLQKRYQVREGHLLAHYLSSHDVPGALYQLGGDVDLFRLAALLQMTAIGIPTIYYGEEVARPGGDWPDNRSDMPWGDREILPGAGEPRDDGLRSDYKRLIAIRRAHPALWRGDHEGMATDGDLLVFARHDPSSDDVVVVAVNRGAEEAAARLAVPEAWKGGVVRDVWKEEPVPLEDGEIAVEVPGRSARILVADHDAEARGG
jgi:glycosidase